MKLNTPYILYMTRLVLKTWLPLLLCACVCTATAQTTYMLKTVDTVTADGMYVFVQQGWAMSNTVSNNALQTTQDFALHGLTGTEPYVWTLEQGTDGFYLRNRSLGSKCYLTYTGSGTAVTLSAKNAYSLWTFDFQTDRTVLIKNKKATSRYLGFVDRGTTYKAYSTDDMTYEHAISVYQLVDDTGEVPTPVVPVPSFSPAEGEVEPGTEVTLTSGASALRYTTDGSDPSTSPTATQTTSATTSVTLATTTTLKAVSVDASGNMSEVVAATYTVRSSQTIDLRNATGVLTFADFRSFPTRYASTEVTADAPASDGNTYPWTVKNVQVDTDGTLLFKASEGQMESLPVGSEHGFIVRVTYDISSTATVSLSVTGGSTVTNTTHYSDGRTQTIATSTPTPSGAVITLSSVKNSFSVSRIDLLPIDANGRPTAIDDSPLLPSPTPQPAACYNLAGQRVHHPTRGLYIAGGKKVWIQ